MKKGITLLFAALLALSLNACDEPQNQDNEKNPVVDVARYTVTFKIDDTIEHTQEINEGESISAFVPNIDITEWYSDSNMNTLYDFSDPIEDDITLYSSMIVINPYDLVMEYLIENGEYTREMTATGGMLNRYVLNLTLNDENLSIQLRRTEAPDSPDITDEIHINSYTDIVSPFTFINITVWGDQSSFDTGEYEMYVNSMDDEFDATGLYCEFFSFSNYSENTLEQFNYDAEKTPALEQYLDMTYNSIYTNMNEYFEDAIDAKVFYTD